MPVWTGQIGVYEQVSAPYFTETQEVAYELLKAAGSTFVSSGYNTNPVIFSTAIGGWAVRLAYIAVIHAVLTKLGCDGNLVGPGSMADGDVVPLRTTG